MGKILDAVLAIFAFIIFLYVMSRMGLTLSQIEGFFRQFFFGNGSSPSNGTGILLVSLAASSSVRKQRNRNKKEIRDHSRAVQFLLSLVGKVRGH